MAAGQSIGATWSATGGQEPYLFSYNWNVKDDGEMTWLDGDWEVSHTSSSFTPRFGQEGRLIVDVRDAAGRYAEKAATFLITGAPVVAPLTLSVQLDKATVAAGQSIGATWSATGGQEPYLFSYEWNVTDDGEETWQDSDWEVSDTASSFTPRFGQEGRLTVWVEDAVGRSTQTETTFLITGAPDVAPLALSVQLDKSTVAAGQSIGATWSASGGQGPYLFSYDWVVTDDGKETYVKVNYEIPDKSSSFTPRFGQEGRLWVQVKDAVGRSISKETTFLITGAPDVAPLTLSVQLDKATVAAGQSIGATWSATGGSGGYFFDVSWRLTAINSETGREQTKTVDTKSMTTDTESSFTPAYGTGGEIFVNVIDAEGRTKGESVSFTVDGGEATVSLPKATLTLSPQAGSQGGVITVSVQATGGTAPYQYAYQWYTFRDNLVIIDWAADSEGFGAAAQHTVTLPGGTDGYVAVTVKDALGRSAIEYKDFKIASATPKPGDATGDGKVDILDLVAIIDHIVSNTSPSSPANADANGDEKVDILDLVWVIDKIVGG